MDQFKKFYVTVDKNLNVIDAEAAFLEFVGRDKVVNLDDVIPPQDLMQLKNAIFAIRMGSLGLCCFRILAKKGGLNWIAANVEKSGNTDDMLLMELSDIQTMKAEGSISQTDEMTGLYNKHSIVAYAQKLTQRFPRRSFYFCLMDIDHFKNVNDSFGHMVGDEVIIDVAHIVRDCVGEEGRVGRIGGDEFMMVLENIDQKPRVREVLASIRETVEEKYRQFRGTLDITVSIGCSLFPDFTRDYDGMFKLTDKMLYLAKVKGRNRYIIYTPEVHGPVDSDTGSVTTKHLMEKDNDKLHMMLGFVDGFMKKSGSEGRMPPPPRSFSWIWSS